MKKAVYPVDKFTKQTTGRYLSMIRKYKDFELEGQKETMGSVKDIFDKSIFSEEQRITYK